MVSFFALLSIPSQDVATNIAASINIKLTFLILSSFYGFFSFIVSLMLFFNLYCTKKCIFVENFSGLRQSNYVPACLEKWYFQQMGQNVHHE
jgi:hypothetical protein